MLNKLLEKSLLGMLGSGLVVGAFAAQFSFNVMPANSAPRTSEGTTTPQPSPNAAPLPESQFTPRARIQLNADRTTIALINNTNAMITYQAIGDTQPRLLQGGERVTLRGLRAPVTLTLDRQDAGLLLVTPKPSATSPATLEVSLDTTTDLSADATTLRVEETGSIYLY